MQWNHTDIKYPDKDMQCLVILKGKKYIQCQSWNNHYQVWDDADGDDYMFDKDAVLYWMPLPSLPIIN